MPVQDSDKFLSYVQGNLICVGWIRMDWLWSHVLWTPIIPV